MTQRCITVKQLSAFEAQLYRDERSSATIQKYRHDLLAFWDFVSNRPLDKALTVAYKNDLCSRLSPSSVNSMLAALNSFFRFMGWHDLRVKRLRIQKQAYCSEAKELSRAEYLRLVRTAKNSGKERLSLLLQTLCSTGIRVSELQYITVESLSRSETVVHCKGKTRTVFLTATLRNKLRRYAAHHQITEGPIFVTRHGTPLNRSNIWREMKALCNKARVSPGKVFPHNLRHLFARLFYALEKDIVKLADVLGHTSIDTTRLYTVTTGAEHRRHLETMRLVI